MNPKPIFNLFSPKGKAQAVVQQGLTTLIISLVALSLLALSACVQVVPASEPVAAIAPPQAAVSEQHRVEALPAVDPADRKFFTPGYGAISGISKEAAALPNIDPADRKFFSPGYGAQTVIVGEAKVLPTIDPADRKFFTPGYGVNAGGNDLTAYHQSEWGRSPNMVLGLEENALAVYHRSEWDRTPNTTLGVAENALAVYHQSEWGRSSNTVLGIEALSKIDPADRKFFSPGYGTQTISDSGFVTILPE